MEVERQQIIENCPACGQAADMTAHEPFTKVTCPACGEAFRARTQFHDFIIRDQIGTGGMSRVFRARDTNLERDVALKILNRECSQDSRRTQQFEREAEITAQMSHPNVVRVFTAGRDQGYFYIAMELVSGGSLEGRLRERKKLPEAQVLEMAIQAVQGLRAAQDASLIHRDIKPGNILFAEDGTPKIADFGLAVFARDADGRGEIWATPYYVPPETLNHEPEDFRSDIYSLGATLYHALTGRPACDRDSASLSELREIKAKPIHPKPAALRLSEETCAMLARSMAVKPGDRYRSYDEFLDHLRHALRRLRRGGKGRPWPGRKRHGLSTWQWSAAAAAVIAAGFGLRAALKEKQVSAPVTISGGSLVTDADPTAGSDSSTSARFLSARDAMLAADFGKARQYFDELGAAGSTREPTRHWARWNAGLCALFMGDTAGARAAYQSLADSGLYSSRQEDADLAQFFAGTSKWLAAAEPVSTARMAECPAGSVRAVGLLAAGLKNWHDGEAAPAAAFLRAFNAAELPRSAAWVESCKKLILDHLTDASAAADLPLPDVAPLSADAADAALSAARQHLTKLKLPGAVKTKAAAAVETLAAAVARRKEQLMAATGGTPAQRAGSEMRLILETNAACAPLGESYRFADAAAKLQSLALTLPQTAAARDAHLDAWQKAAAFVEQLAKDLTKQPVEGLMDQNGGAVRAACTIAGGFLTGKPSQGAEIKVPLARVPPARLVELASDVLLRITDADEYYRRCELLYCFALRTGLKNTATAAGENLAAELRRFRQQFTLLNTVEVNISPEPEPPR